MATWANLSYLSMLLSWVFHAERAGIDYYIIGALDGQLLSELLARGLPAFALDLHASKSDMGWLGPEFRKMVRGAQTWD